MHERVRREAVKQSVRDKLREHGVPVAIRFWRAMAEARETHGISRDVADPSDYLRVIDVVATHWVDRWREAARPTLLRRKFARKRRMASYMDGVAGQVRRKFGPDVVLLMGNAASGPGGFGRVHGGGPKPPIKALTHALARHFPVVLCCEYHTSAACRICGRAVRHPPKKRRNKRTGKMETIKDLRVSYCNQRDHHFRVDRDGDAALKIMARFLASLTGKSGADLGPWDAEGWRNDAESKAFKTGRPKVKTHSVLQSALKAYDVEHRWQRWDKAPEETRGQQPRQPRAA